MHIVATEMSDILENEDIQRRNLQQWMDSSGKESQVDSQKK